MSIKVVDIIVERRGKILLIKRGDFWILPGGELEPGEDELECLNKVVQREMKDQVSSIFHKLENTIKGPSPVRDGDVEVSIYVGDIGKKMSEIATRTGSAVRALPPSGCPTSPRQCSITTTPNRQ